MQALDRQLEQILAQQVQILYSNLLGHVSARVMAQMVEQRVIISIKNAVTRPEQLLIGSRVRLAQQVRACLDEVMQPQIKVLIEEVTQSEVNSLVMTTHFDRSEIIIIAIFTTEMTGERLIRAISHTAKPISGSNVVE
jgi:uncharacterized protein YbcI